jgi:ribosomal protein L32
VEKQTCRRKAPTITATGCPTCGTLGIPGTVCRKCVEAAHASAVRSTSRAYILADRTSTARMFADDARATWAGAELLLDYFGTEPALWRVGFEVPASEERR